MADPRNVAVVGCGYWGKNLVRNFSELGALAWICDQDEVVLRAQAGLYPAVRATGSLDDVLTAPEVKAVVIASPAALHFEHALAALEAGKDVFVEKPLALRYRDGMELVETARQKNRVLMVLRVGERSASRNGVGRWHCGGIRGLRPSRWGFPSIFVTFLAPYFIDPHKYPHLANLGVTRRWKTSLWHIRGSGIIRIALTYSEGGSGQHQSTYHLYLKGPAKADYLVDRKSHVLRSFSVVMYQQSPLGHTQRRLRSWIRASGYHHVVQVELPGRC
jgi:hypothetical protein